jgi:hypothetical protein
MRGTPKNPKDLKPHPCGEHEGNTKKTQKSSNPILVGNMRGTPKNPKNLKPHPCGEHEGNTKKTQKISNPILVGNMRGTPKTPKNLKPHPLPTFGLWGIISYFFASKYNNSWKPLFFLSYCTSHGSSRLVFSKAFHWF